MTPEDGGVLSDRELIERTHRYARETAEDMAAIRKVIEDLRDEVGPTIDTLMANPMFKMLVPRKGKN